MMKALLFMMAAAPEDGCEQPVQATLSGQQLYAQTCAPCHQPSGQGIAAVFPPLTRSDFLNAQICRAIHVVSHGLQGPIVVNGQPYSGAMPDLGLRPAEVAAVLTYVYTFAGNLHNRVSVDQVGICAGTGTLVMP